MPQSKIKSFNQIKIHSQYSICEGALKIEDLKEYCKKNKIRTVGISDTYNLSGALEFSENISSVGTQPIIGSQINLKYKNHIGKIPLFSKNLEGYKNLIKLSSKSFLDIKDEGSTALALDYLKKSSDLLPKNVLYDLLYLPFRIHYWPLVQTVLWNNV